VGKDNLCSLARREGQADRMETVVDEQESGAEYVRAKAEEAQNTPVRIALFGQPGAGKSSLINAIVGQKLAPTGVENDVTTSRNDYNWNGLTLSDLPGYGTAKFPASDYFAKFEILTFDVFLCVVSEKLRDNDVAFFQKLGEAGKNCIFVRNKIDTVYEQDVPETDLRRRTSENLRAQIGGKAPIVFTSCRSNEGLDDLANSIQDALSGVKRDRFLRAAAVYSKEFLEKKKKACQNYALMAAGAAAVTNAAPLPGLGIVADLAAIVGMMVSIRMDFGLSEARLDNFARFMPSVAPFVRNLVEMASREGATLLLRQFIGPVATAEVSKYIPIVGSVIAASLSFLTVRFILFKYIEDCSEIAAEMLEAHFQ
jgi:GTP-binding protein EngB required for normal cell division